MYDESMLTADDESTRNPSMHMARLMPLVSFGVRATALAGLIVSVGGAAVSLTGIGPAIVGVDSNSTCCG